MKELQLNKIYQGNALDILRQMPDGCVDTCITSSPYYGLRSYKTAPQIWDDDKNCQHEWGDSMPRVGSRYRNDTGNVANKKTKEIAGVNNANSGEFCIRCGAWRGELGQEPKLEFFINHLIQIFAEVYRVLKPTGSCWVVMGDSRASKGGASRHFGYTDPKYSNGRAGDFKEPTSYPQSVRALSLCMIPGRFALAMCDKLGFILINRITWKKNNVLPQSNPNRFTDDSEDVFFFVKSNTPQYYVNEKTLKTQKKQPIGIKGIENEDWEWRDCSRCSIPEVGSNTGSENKEYHQVNNPHQQRLIVKDKGDAEIENLHGTCIEQGRIIQIGLRKTKILKEDAETMGSPRARYHRTSPKETCNRCKGTGKVKNSLWSSRNYFFRQQFEPFKETSVEKLQRGVSDNHKYSDADIGQTKQGLFKPRQKVMPPIGGVKRSGGDNPIYSGNRPAWSELGRNLRTTWENKNDIFEINTKPLKDTHYAAFPPELVRRCVEAGSPEEICNKCGLPKELILKSEPKQREVEWHNEKYGEEDEGSKRLGRMQPQQSVYNTKVKKGYSNCGCGDSYSPGICLDPFMGSGTTAIVARKHGRNFVGTELNPDYVKMALKRIRDELGLFETT